MLWSAAGAFRLFRWSERAGFSLGEAVCKWCIANLIRQRFVEACRAKYCELRVYPTSEARKQQGGPVAEVRNRAADGRAGSA